MTNRVNLLRGCLKIIPAVMIAMGISSQLSAAVLATESFSYATGSGLNGLNGGTGWSSAWSNAAGNVPVASTNTSLSYPSSTNLSSAGSRLQLTSTSTAATATRNLTTGMNLGTNNNEFYSSFLVNISAIGQTATVQFQDTANNIRWSYGINATGNFTVGVAPENVLQNAATSFTAATGTTYLVVAKIRTNTASNGFDEVFLKVFDPSSGVTMPLDDNSWDARANGNSGVILSRTNLVFNNPGNQNLQFDELRIGTTFADVAGVPEPSRMMLLGLTAMALLMPRRRKS